MSLVPVPHCGATLSAPAAHPRAKPVGQLPLNLNIRSLWFEALGCSAPSVDLKGKHDSSVAVSHQKTHTSWKTCLCCVSSNLNALKQTVALEQDPSTPPPPLSKEKREMMERENGREGGRDGDGEKRRRSEKREREKSKTST